LQKLTLLSVEERAKELGYDISSILPDTDLSKDNIDEKYIDDVLQTLHYPNEMDKILKNIERNARSIIEETGSNMLYLVLGFLNWYESDHSDIINKSPLVAIPVTLSKTKYNNSYQYKLVYSGEGLEINRSLAEKLLSDFGIILPELTEDMSYSEYIEEVMLVIKNKKKWRIEQGISLDFLHFGKILMYQDLKEKNWNNELSSNPILKDIFIGKDSTANTTFASEYDIDNIETANSIPLVMDADSSQHSAIIDAVENKNVIIEGPPGTGKSQTIANIIASLLAQGKTILFVSEKLAALEVVYRRLEKIGLSDFILELHSNKSKKVQVLNSIKKRLDSQYPDINELEYTIKDIDFKKNELREYINIIHKHYGKIDQFIYSIFWKTELYRDGIKDFTFDIPSAKEYTYFNFNYTLDELKKFRHFHENYDFESFFWRGIDLYKLNFTNIDNFLVVLENIKEKYKTLQEKVIEIPCDFDNEYDDVKIIHNFINSYQLPKHIDPLLLIHLHENKNHFNDYLTIFDSFNKATARLEEILQKYSNYANFNDKFISKLDILEKGIKKLHIDFGIQKNFDIEFIKLLINVFESLEHIDINLYQHVSTHYGTMDFETIIKEAMVESNKIKDYRTKVSEYSDIDIINAVTFEEINEIERIIESKKQSLFNIFSGEYKKTLKEFQSLLKAPLPDDKSEWTQILKEIKLYMQSYKKYNENSKYIINFGNLLKGIDTNWEEILKLNDWAKKLRSITKNIDLLNILLSPSQDKYKEFLVIKNKLKDNIIELDNLYDSFSTYYEKQFVRTLIRSKEDINVVELKDKIENLNNDLESISLRLKKELNLGSSSNTIENIVKNTCNIDFIELDYLIQKFDIRIDDSKRYLEVFIQEGYCSRQSS